MKIKNGSNDVFVAKKVEVTLEECGGDFNKMLKKFSRKVRKEELLKPFYGRLMFHTTKGQKARAKRLRGKYLAQRKAEKFEDEE